LGRDVVVFTPDVPSVTTTPSFSAANNAEEVGFGNVVSGDAEVVSSGVSSSEEDNDGSTADVASNVALVTPAP
jgi:hypothetical protein